MTKSRPLPHNVNMEKMLIAAFVWLNDANFVKQLTEALPPDLMYNPKHQIMLDTLGALAETGTVDANSFLISCANIDEIGGTAYVAEILAEKTTPARETVRNWSFELVDLAHRRARLRQIMEMSAMLYDGAVSGADVEKLDADYIRSNMALYSREIPSDLQDDVDDFLAYVAYLKELRANGKILRTYILELDTKGPMLPEFICIAARPSIGKTALSLSMLLRQALNGHRVLFFSMEQDRRNMIQKMVSVFSGLSGAHALGVVEGADEHADTVLRCTKIIRSLSDRVHVLYGQKTVEQVRSACFQVQEQHGIEAVYIDQISKFIPTDRKMTKEAQYSHVSGTLFQCQRALQVPLVLLAQIDHKGSRDNPVPHFDKVRWCGQIKEDVDRAIVLDRPEAEEDRFRMFEKRRIEAGGNDGREYDMRNLGVVRQEKDRNGLSGGQWRADVAFNKHCGLFGAPLRAELIDSVETKMSNW